MRDIKGDKKSKQRLNISFMKKKSIQLIQSIKE